MKPKKMASATSQPIKTVKAVDDMNVTSCDVDIYRFGFPTMCCIRVTIEILLRANFIRIYGMILLTGNMFQDVHGLRRYELRPVVTRQGMKHFRTG